jgi:cell wall-associated NlpC family hydrolase
MNQGEKIAEAAKKWLGTPQINNAKVRGVGIDCGMLLLASTEDAGLIAKDSVKVEPYSNEWHLHRSEEWFLHYVEQHCEKVTDLKAGDFLLYQYGRCISHGAVYVGDGMVVHALVNQGVIMSNMNETMFYDAKGRSRLRGIYRFKE